MMAKRLGQTGACPRRRPSATVPIDKIPRNTPIVDCGSYYVAQLDAGPAVVDPGRHPIETKSRLRRAVSRGGRLTGAKRSGRRGGTSHSFPTAIEGWEITYWYPNHEGTHVQRVVGHDAHRRRREILAHFDAEGIGYRERTIQKGAR